jgi:hypothetical protein
MRRAIVATAVLALAAAPAPAHAQPSDDEIRGLVAVSFGMRGNQGGVLEGGFRLMMVAALLTPVVDVGLSLDRQIGFDNRAVDDEGDVARWSEWVAALRVGRRFPLTKGFRAQTMAGLAMLHTRVTGPVGVPAPLVDNALNLGADVAAGLAWYSESLVVNLSFGVTLVPSSQELVVDVARYDLPARAELWTGLGIGFTL